MSSISIKYLIILGILTAFGPICTDFYLPALPEITHNLNTSVTMSQLTLTASLIGLGIGQLFFGPWSDRIGRKTPLLIALSLFILSSVICMLVNNIEQLIAARFVQGFAGAGGAVLALAMAKDLYSGLELARFFALMFVITETAPIIAPILGGIQLNWTHWQGLFASLAILGMIILIICAIFLKESHSDNAKTESLFLAFKTIIKNKFFILFCLIQSFAMGGLFAYIGASSYVFQNIYDFSPQQYSLLFACNGLGLVISALITSKLLKFYQTPRLLGWGLYLAVIASLILVILSLIHAPMYMILISLFITLAVVTLICTITMTLAMESQVNFSGTASALLGFCMFSFGGFTAPLTTLLETSLFSMSVVIFGCYLLGLICYWLFSKKSKIEIL
ncbi:multidrug effflux MFS transporter [Acinetobacter baylyi]|uniref:multidrug effflux MFS transporter n=1 Tax=Acinetobacter baylyi TaxID=202950 RepID=UPI000EA24644|nr:multidrug effflux MFS transporter [Acinetobacter baylyi]